VRLITRAGNDFSSRFPFIAMAVGKLPVRSCLIDGEATVCDENGLAVFDLIAAVIGLPLNAFAPPIRQDLVSDRDSWMARHW
jgi:hypothetical protein